MKCFNELTKLRLKKNFFISPFEIENGDTKEGTYFQSAFKAIHVHFFSLHIDLIQFDK